MVIMSYFLDIGPLVNINYLERLPKFTSPTPMWLSYSILLRSTVFML